MMDNILASKLYRPGSVAYVSRSGGMSNEVFYCILIIHIFINLVEQYSCTQY